MGVYLTFDCALASTVCTICGIDGRRKARLPHGWKRPVMMTFFCCCWSVCCCVFVVICEIKRVDVIRLVRDWIRVEMGKLGAG